MVVLLAKGLLLLSLNLVAGQEILFPGNDKNKLLTEK
jgi:hypothetical protein